MATDRPSFPPGVLEALKRGDKIEAIKLLRQATRMGLAETKALVDAMEAQKPKVKAKVSANAPSIRIHHHAPSHYIPHSRSGLSPGEVPRTGGSFGWLWAVLFVAAVGFLLAR